MKFLCLDVYPLGVTPPPYTIPPCLYLRRRIKTGLLNPLSSSSGFPVNVWLFKTYQGYPIRILQILFFASLKIVRKILRISDVYVYVFHF